MEECVLQCVLLYRHTKIICKIFINMGIHKQEEGFMFNINYSHFLFFSVLVMWPQISVSSFINWDSYQYLVQRAVVRIKWINRQKCLQLSLAHTCSVNVSWKFGFSELGSWSRLTVLFSPEFEAHCLSPFITKSLE